MNHLPNFTYTDHEAGGITYTEVTAYGNTHSLFYCEDLAGWYEHEKDLINQIIIISHTNVE